VNESEELDQSSQYSHCDQIFRVDSSGHVPVLFRETLDALNPKPGDVYVDLTAGRGGHAAAVARRLSPSGRVVLFDLDAGNLAFASDRVRRESGLEVVAIQGSFASVQRELAARGLTADLVLADLGFSSTQVDDPARGLSFLRDGPLDMRLDPSAVVTARDIVNGSSEREIADILFRFGDEEDRSQNCGGSCGRADQYDGAAGGSGSGGLRLPRPHLADAPSDEGLHGHPHRGERRARRA
jgi:16S rRNA (cytosine1402-N4)-methyltransferase